MKILATGIQNLFWNFESLINVLKVITKIKQTVVVAYWPFQRLKVRSYFRRHCKLRTVIWMIQSGSNKKTSFVFPSMALEILYKLPRMKYNCRPFSCNTYETQ